MMLPTGPEAPLDVTPTNLKQVYKGPSSALQAALLHISAETASFKKEHSLTSSFAFAVEDSSTAVVGCGVEEHADA